MASSERSYAPVSTPAAGGQRDPGCATQTLLAAVTQGLLVVREPRLVRERFEQELRLLLNAQSVALRHEGEPSLPQPNIVCIDVPAASRDSQPRLEAAFAPGHKIDAHTRLMLGAAAQIAGLLMAIERASGRWPLACARSRPDAAAALIGSSRAMREVRERIARVAVTDFTVLIEGASGPQPHPSFIDLFCEAPSDDSYGEVAGAGEEALRSR